MNKLATFFRESSLPRFLIPFGLLAIIMGVYVLITSIKNQNYIETEAVVSNAILYQDAYTDDNGDYVEATYTIYIKYSVNGTEYEENIGELSGYKIGDKMTIYYNPDDPKDITQSKNIIIPIVIIVVGCGALTYGVISGINAVKKHKKLKEQEKGWKNE